MNQKRPVISLPFVIVSILVLAGFGGYIAVFGNPVQQYYENMYYQEEQAKLKKQSGPPDEMPEGRPVMPGTGDGAGPGPAAGGGGGGGRRGRPSSDASKPAEGEKPAAEGEKPAAEGDKPAEGTK